MRPVVSAKRLALAAFFGAAVLRADDPVLRAEKLLARKDYAAAEGLLREAIDADPTSARAHGNLALALLSQGKTREAVDEARLAAAFGPESAEARAIYGLALEALGRFGEAIRELEKATALKPEAPGPAGALARAYARIEDERAAAAYESLFRLQPHERAPRVELAEFLWKVEKNEQGNRAIAEAIRIFPDDAELHRRYGRALFQQERFLDAATELRKARGGNAQDAAALSLLAHSLWRSGRAEEARDAFGEALAVRPNDADLRRSLGRLLLSRGENGAARRELERAALLKPTDAGIQYDLGRACEAEGSLADAEAAYRKAVSLAPRLASARYALGRALLRRGARDEGARELAAYQTLYEEASKRSGEENVRRARLAAGWAELSRGNAREALAKWETLAETADVFFARAAALSRLGRHREALDLLERARALAPDDDRISARLLAERSLGEEAAR